MKSGYLILVLIIIGAVLINGCTQHETAIQADGQNDNLSETAIQTEEQTIAEDEKYFILNSFEPKIEMKDNEEGVFRINYSTNLDHFTLAIIAPDGSSNSASLKGSFGTAWMKIPPKGNNIKLPGNYNVIITDNRQTAPSLYETVTSVDKNFTYKKGGQLSIVNLSIDSWSKTPGPNSNDPLWWINSMSIWVKNSGDLPSYARIHSKRKYIDLDGTTKEGMMTFTTGSKPLGWVDAGETKLFKIKKDWPLDGVYYVDLNIDENRIKEDFPFEIYLISFFDHHNEFYYTSKNPYKIISLWDSNYLLLDKYSGTIHTALGEYPTSN